MRIPRTMWVAVLVCAPGLFMMCNKPGDFAEENFDPRLSGGAATVFDATSKSFSHMVDGLKEYDEHIHELGDGQFEQSFVTAPAPVNSGLGPIFNNVSCISCHHNDGKGTPTAGAVNSSLLIRLSLPGQDEHGGPVAVPGYGLQLQDVSVFGKQPEARVNISYTESTFTFPDGEQASLRKPDYTLLTPYMALPAGYMLSPRMAPPVFGLGLIEAVPESTILSFADEDDTNGDGISGKPNYVWNGYTQKMELGRFGLKANAPSLQIQVAGAYQQDMGVSSYVFPTESSIGQSQGDGYKDDPEIPDSLMNSVAFYVRTLAVPARRNVTDANVVEGEKIFTQINCVACHKPTVYTGVNTNLPTLSNQRIHPYADFLLHDMGDGLADGRPDFRANGQEWRTATLWGIGLFPKTNGTAFYLHDGRARTLEEAILWHGGEAEQAKQKFVQLTTTERKSLISFLKSL